MSCHMQRTHSQSTSVSAVGPVPEAVSPSGASRLECNVNIFRTNAAGASKVGVRRGEFGPSGLDGTNSVPESDYACHALKRWHENNIYFEGITLSEPLRG
jgi:hypothetical protein